MKTYNVTSDNLHLHMLLRKPKEKLNRIELSLEKKPKNGMIFFTTLKNLF